MLLCTLLLYETLVIITKIVVNSIGGIIMAILLIIQVLGIHCTICSLEAC